MNKVTSRLPLTEAAIAAMTYISMPALAQQNQRSTAPAIAKQPSGASAAEATSAPKGSSAASEKCPAYQATITRALKEAAYHGAVSVMDQSAPRATVAELRRQNNLTVVAINAQLMATSGCPASTASPQDDSKYGLQALTCTLKEKLKGADSPETKAECDRDSWAN